MGLPLWSGGFVHWNVSAYDDVATVGACVVASWVNV